MLEILRKVFGANEVADELIERVGQTFLSVSLNIRRGWTQISGRELSGRFHFARTEIKTGVDSDWVNVPKQRRRKQAPTVVL